MEIKKRVQSQFAFLAKKRRSFCPNSPAGMINGEGFAVEAIGTFP